MHYFIQKYRIIETLWIYFVKYIWFTLWRPALDYKTIATWEIV